MMSKSILNGSEIRAAVGVDNLKTLRKDYKLLDWFNTLNHVERGCWFDRDYDALESLLSFIRDEYKMVPSKCRDGSADHYNLTYKGEPDAWVEDE